MDLCDLFDKPIRSRAVRKGVTAYQYRNGVININGEKFQEYSLAEAIALYRKKFPAYR